MLRQDIIYKEHRMIGQGAIFLCAVLWSTSGLFIKLVDWNPVVIAGSRSLLAAVFLLVLRCFSVRRNSAKPVTLKEMPGLAVCGLCYAATMILFVIANKLTASANAILIQYAAPVWAALLAWFFLREKPRWENWGALVLVSLGMFMVFSGGLAAGSLLGDICALISGIAFGANSVVMRAQKDGNPADIMIAAHIITVLFSIPFFFLHPPVMNAANVLSIAFMGIFQIGAASALFAFGIRRVPAAQAMLTATVEPVLNPVWVLLVTGERPSPSVLAGGGIILAAVLLSSILSTLRRRN
ncbi:MAG: DMT family transporter [Treponema sp.]|jgi:drug/metabolite transporter (DMT)-like permease|nr:DMT family transporter [Treponema sp.]